MIENATTDRWVIAAVVASCAIAGVCIWYAAPAMINHPGYWKWDDRLYWAYLLTVGVIGGLACPRRWWAPSLGIYIGQVVGTLACLPPDPLAPLGWFLTLPIASLATLAASVAVVFLRAAIAAVRRL
jgi:hypothetical protein